MSLADRIVRIPAPIAPWLRCSFSVSVDAGGLTTVQVTYYPPGQNTPIQCSFNGSALTSAAISRLLALWVDIMTVAGPKMGF